MFRWYRVKKHTYDLFLQKKKWVTMTNTFSQWRMIYKLHIPKKFQDLCFFRISRDLRFYCRIFFILFLVSSHKKRVFNFLRVCSYFLFLCIFIFIDLNSASIFFFTFVIFESERERILSYNFWPVKSKNINFKSIYLNKTIIIFPLLSMDFIGAQILWNNFQNELADSRCRSCYAQEHKRRPESNSC